jgi:hypothetical protein
MARASGRALREWVSIISPVSGSTITPGCRRQAVATAVCAGSGPDIEQIAVPRTAQPAILRHRILQRTQPMRANRTVRDERPVLELENAKRLPAKLDYKRQPFAQFAQKAERERGRGRLRSGFPTRRQGFPAHHHRFVLIPEQCMARPIFLAKRGEPVRLVLRQIKVYFDPRPPRPERLQHGPNFCSRAGTREGADAVPYIGPVEPQLRNHSPTPGADSFGELDPPAPVADFKKRDRSKINLVERWQVLPIEQVLPYAIDPGADLAGIYRAKGERCRDPELGAIDRHSGLQSSGEVTGSEPLISQKQLADRAEKFHFRAPLFGLPLGIETCPETKTRRRSRVAAPAVFAAAHSSAASLHGLCLAFSVRLRDRALSTERAG